MLGRYGRHYVVPSWRLFDATGKSVGKLASGLTRYLQGKHKPNFDPSQINGDYCVVINARFVQFRGENAWRDKKYFSHSGYPGGLKIQPAFQEMNKDPTSVLRRAVRRMLPNNHLRRGLNDGKSVINRRLCIGGLNNRGVAQRVIVIFFC